MFIQPIWKTKTKTKIVVTVEKSLYNIFFLQKPDVISVIIKYVETGIVTKI